MNQVITAEQAKKITGGRTPLVPVEYETAINALVACIAIDEAKIWSDKADALAAWAKIYHSGDAQRKAAQLKLHAYKRMGELAKELRPLRPYRVVDDSRIQGGRRAQAMPGANALLRESGLKKAEAAAALKLAGMPIDQFEQLKSAPKIPTPIMASKGESFSIQLLIASHLSGAAAGMRQMSSGEFLKNPPAKGHWRENAEEIYDWLTVVLQKRK